MIEKVVCPRCHKESLNKEKVMNSLSNIGNKVYICNDCGRYQGAVGMGICLDIVEMEMEKRFRKELGVN